MMDLKPRYSFPAGMAAEQLNLIDKRFASTRAILKQACFNEELARLIHRNKDLVGLLSRYEFVFEQMNINPRESKFWAVYLPDKPEDEDRKGLEAECEDTTETPEDAVELKATFKCNGKRFSTTWLIDKDALPELDWPVYASALLKTMDRRHDMEVASWTVD